MNRAPKHPQDMLQKRSASRVTRLSSDDQLTVPRTNRKTFASRSFSVAGPELWNETPLHITNSNSLSDFKSRLKMYRFKKYLHR